MGCFETSQVLIPRLAPGFEAIETLASLLVSSSRGGEDAWDKVTILGLGVISSG